MSLLNDMPLQSLIAVRFFAEPLGGIEVSDGPPQTRERAVRAARSTRVSERSLTGLFVPSPGPFRDDSVRGAILWNGHALTVDRHGGARYDGRSGTVDPLKWTVLVETAIGNAGPSPLVRWTVRNGTDQTLAIRGGNGRALARIPGGSRASFFSLSEDLTLERLSMRPLPLSFPYLDTAPAPGVTVGRGTWPGPSSSLPATLRRRTVHRTLTVVTTKTP